MTFVVLLTSNYTLGKGGILEINRDDSRGGMKTYEEDIGNKVLNSLKINKTKI